MTENLVQCTFHNISSNNIEINSSLIDINKLTKEKSNELSYKCSLINAYKIRSNLIDILDKYSYIWFSIDYSNNLSKKLDNNFYPIDHIYFGSLLSTEKFLIHDIPFNKNLKWIIKILNNQTLIIETKENDSSSIRLSIPINYLHKQILVIDNEDFSEFIFNFNIITIDIEINKKYQKMYGNNSIVQSLNQCSDFLICLSTKSTIDLLLNYFEKNFHFKIYYTIIQIQKNSFHWTNNFLYSYETDNNRYSILMLHSLGYVFDDKYLSDNILQNFMIKLSKENEIFFYNLSLKIYNELKKCHWIDLKKFFEYNYQIYDNKFLHISVIHITPTRFLIMPKEKFQGHRALRYKYFQGVKDFFLVYLKPDPPNIYFNDNYHLIEYFQEIFQLGFDFNDNHYHLFGASNSQLKDHSFWFIKALTLNDIQQKRQLLGDFNQIFNIGTYVARLGLWFSKTESTNIILNYCSNENEFNSKIKQGEMCIMMIEDIERNNYCFTDGNGLISKGLAKLITNKLNYNRQKSFYIPSAYQIRIAGCKGLIIIDSQSTYDQFYIKIRPSMKKFECNDWSLDICGYSKATPSRLNNQFIWLLSDLGVSDKIFFQLQQRWFNKKPSRSIYSDDILKNKIPLPVNECRYIYGCAFESQLKEGQCFIRYEVLNDNGKSFSNSKFECVRGRVIVTKNPCPYAGDMLELWAVDLPELYHLNDVIVFSIQGQRPDFNKIAGSDLDGDGYFIYWGEELRLKYQVKPLDYTPDEKQYQSTPISPKDVINYCLSILNATSSGEIYNLHATILDKNIQNYQQRSCQPLAIELARMFSSAVDSAKTGYVIDKKRLQKIREECGQKYPDFLGKDEKKSYKSQSIVGKLYHNALYYIHGKLNQLEDIFAQLNIDNNEQTSLIHRSSISESIISSSTIDKSTQLHPGSPLSPISNLISINMNNLIINYDNIPHQLFLIDGMISSSFSSIKLCPSTKPYYNEHKNIIRLCIELENNSNNYLKSSNPSLSSIFFEQLSSFDYLINKNELSKMIISFGYIYLLKYNNDYPKTLNCLLNKHFLPPLFDTFFPSTILEQIEITKENSHYLQQIFYKSNYKIKREYIELDNNCLYLVFPWFKMNLIEHQREIILICLNIKSNNEICIHFDKNGRIKFIEHEPKIFFKCFHQQNSFYHSDILYEYRSYSLISKENYSLIFKHETLLDPTHPLTLPLQEHIIPIISYSIIKNIFQYNNIEIHIKRIYLPIHYKNDDYYKLRCILGYIEQQEHSVEINIQKNNNEKFNREYLRYIMSLAIELSQMLD